MNHYGRALRLAFAYKYRFAVSVFCAILGAALFGGNLTVAFPLLRVLLYDQTLHEWVADKATEQRTSLQAIENEIGRRQRGEPAAVGPNEVAGQRLDLLSVAAQRQRAKVALYDRLSGFVSRVVPRDRWLSLVMVVGLMVFGFALKGFFEFSNEVLAASVTQRTVNDLRNEFYRRTLHMDLAGFTQQRTAEMMARFTSDMKQLTMGIDVLIGKVVREPLKAVACITLACWVNWRLTLVAACVVPVAIVVMAIIGRSIKRAAKRCLESMSSIYQILQETLQGIKIVKAFTMEPAERVRFYRETESYYKKSMRIARLEAMADPLLAMIAMGAVGAAVLAGSYLVINGKQTILGIRLSNEPLDAESLFMVFACLAGVSDPIRKLTNVYARVQGACAAAERIFGLMDSQPKITVSSHAPRLARHARSVELVNVSFSYPGTGPILQDVNLKVAFGETVAIVGPNGCGKTTLLSLLPRFYDPDAGRILIDGVDTRTVQVRSLRKQFGIVTQETVLFNDTIRANIAYGKPTATDAEVEAAASKAYAHRFIEQLPAGYDTNVGEKALKLSGGQRQRIALARAILRDPTILVLDEATSALDVESESLIQKVLEEFTRGRTTFLITHRLASLQLADRIIVMNAGRIEDQGKHDELLARCRLYARLHEIDMAGRYAPAA